MVLLQHRSIKSFTSIASLFSTLKMGGFSVPLLGTPVGNHRGRASLVQVGHYSHPLHRQHQRRLCGDGAGAIVISRRAFSSWLWIPSGKRLHSCHSYGTWTISRVLKDLLIKMMIFYSYVALPGGIISCLVVWNMSYLFHSVGNLIFPTIIFQRS